MVRLVFRPYAQFWQSICTSELLRSSIRVSPDFDLIRHSSPSFGSYPICSWYTFHMLAHMLIKVLRDGRGNLATNLVIPYSYVYYANRFQNYPFTRTLDRLLGPCFKTGPKGIPNWTAVDRIHIHSRRKASDAETSVIWSLKSIRQSLRVLARLPDDTHNRWKIAPFVPINFARALRWPNVDWHLPISNGSRRLTKGEVHTKC
jgi:hypothetical protein